MDELEVEAKLPQSLITRKNKHGQNEIFGRDFANRIKTSKNLFREINNWFCRHFQPVETLWMLVDCIFGPFLRKCGASNAVDLCVQFSSARCNSASLVIHELEINKPKYIIWNSVVSSVFCDKILAVRTSWIRSSYLSSLFITNANLMYCLVKKILEKIYIFVTATLSKNHGT